MKRILSCPVILPMSTCDESPRTLPFPRRVKTRRCAPAKRSSHDRDADLADVRDKLFRMIVANEWDRSHGNRAS